MEAQSAIGTKHISGIRRWKLYSKIKFFATQFDNGKDINFISNITSVNKSRIITDIKACKLIKYVYEIDLWSAEDKERIFNFADINISIFTKALTLKSEILDEYMSVLLKLKYHPRTLEPDIDKIKLIASYRGDKDIQFRR